MVDDPELRHLAGDSLATRRDPLEHGSRLEFVDDARPHGALVAGAQTSTDQVEAQVVDV